MTLNIQIRGISNSLLRLIFTSRKNLAFYTFRGKYYAGKYNEPSIYVDFPCSVDKGRKK